LLGERLLHEAVLEGVVREHCDATTGFERVERLIESCLELSQLVINFNPESLKGSPGRMAASSPRRSRDRLFHDLGQLLGVCDGACGDDGPGDPRCEPLFPEPADHRSQIALGVIVDDGRSPEPLLGVHPHVERSSLTKAEASLGIVQLGGRNAKVE
jgi:hypothetical protein